MMDQAMHCSAVTKMEWKIYESGVYCTTETYGEYPNTMEYRFNLPGKCNCKKYTILFYIVLVCKHTR